MNGDAIRRTADRLIDQLTHIQRTHGELSGVIVHEEPNSSWCDPPILHRGHFVFDGPVTCHIWTETNLPADEQNQFERLCPSLGDLAFQLQDNAPASLRGWIQTSDPSVLRWLWFLGGFVVTKLPGRTPRTQRYCWGSNGHEFNAEQLDSMRKNFPAGIVQPMPPDASCWLIELKNIIQLSIEAVEYLVNTQLAPELTGSTSDSNSIDMQQQKLEESGQEPVERIAVEWNQEKILADAAKQFIQLESELKANESAIQSLSPGPQAHAHLKSKIDELTTAVAHAKHVLSLLRIGHESEFVVERKIQRPGQLVELEPTKGTFKPSSQPTQTPCPHCGDLVYVLATTCIHCGGPLRFNPPAPKGSLEAYRILTGWRQPEIHPLERERETLVENESGDNTSGVLPVTTEPAAAIVTTSDGPAGMRQAQPPKIIVPTNEDVARVCNLVAEGMPVQTAAKEVAKNSVHKAGSLKTMYYAYLRRLKKQIP